MTSVPVLACTVPFAVAVLAFMRAQDRDAGCDRVPREALVEAAAVGASLRLAVFVPLFAWAASGALLPAIITAAAWSVGVRLRRRASPGTPSEGMVRSRVPSPAAGRLVGLALVALIVAEATALTAVLRLAMPASTTVVAVVSFAALGTGAWLGAASSAGTRRTLNALLGLVLLGVAGFTMLVLYAHLSALTSATAVVGVAQLLALLAAIGMLVSGRTKYVDTHADGREPPDATLRLVRRSAKLLNVVLSTLLGIAIVLVAMSFVHGIELDGLSFVELLPGRRWAGLVATLAVLAAIGGFVAGGEPRRQGIVRVHRTRAFEPALMFVLVAASAAIAAAGHGGTGVAAAQALLLRMAGEATLLDTLALACIVVAASAAAIAAFTSTFASLPPLPMRAPAALRAAVMAIAIAVVVALAASPGLFGVALGIAGCLALPAMVLGWRGRG